MHEASWPRVKLLRLARSRKDFLTACGSVLVGTISLISLVLSPLVLFSWGLLGAAREPLLVPLWASRGPLRALLGAPWRPLGSPGRSGASPGPSGSVPGPLLGASWAALGVSWAALGPILGRSWPLLARSWGLLGVSWGLLGRSWQPTASFSKIVLPLQRQHDFQGSGGPKLAPSWPKLAPSWPKLGPSWPKLAPSWPKCGSWALLARRKSSWAALAASPGWARVAALTKAPETPYAFFV